MGIRYRALTWCARKQPTLVKAALWIGLRVQLSLPHRAPQGDRLSTIRDVLNIVNYRVPARARLGNGMQVTVPWNDDGGRAIYETGSYEPQTVKLFEELLAPGMVVFDVGANIGQYTLLASARVGYVIGPNEPRSLNVLAIPRTKVSVVVETLAAEGRPSVAPHAP